MRYRQSFLQAQFDDYKKKKCPSCQYNMYCNVLNEGDSDKAQWVHKGKGKVTCENYKPRYLGKRIEL